MFRGKLFLYLIPRDLMAFAFVIHLAKGMIQMNKFEGDLFIFYLIFFFLILALGQLLHGAADYLESLLCC